MKVLVIGGVAAGTKAAAKMKRMDRGAEVTILTKGKDISYAGCGLPYYVGGSIEEKSQLIVNTPEKFSALTGAQVLTEREAICLDPSAKQVTAKNLHTGQEETYAYDVCVIAVGASAVVPNMEGSELSGVFCMRTPEDAEGVRDYIEKIEKPAGKRAVVAGGGFIGLEMAENLAEKGMAVTVVELAGQIMPGFDVEMADYAKRHLQKKGIQVLTETRLEAVLGEGRVEGVRTSRGELKADVLVLSLGIRPNTAFLKETGMEMMPNGTIVVDGQMKTSIDGVYAAGDCVCVTNRQTGARAWSPMGSSANMEGRTLARVLGGEKVSYPGVLGTAVLKMPELCAGRTGLTEAAAKQAGYDVESVIVVEDDKAHYYPGAGSLIIKLIAEKKTEKLLGLQVLGSAAVDKVTDVAVTAISMGACLSDLENLDLAYAPPFSTAIHPFVHAVNVLENKMDGTMQSASPADFMAGKYADYRIVDAAGAPAIPGTLFADVAKVTEPLPNVGKDEKLLLVCTRGKRAYLLQNRLKYLGYTNTLVLEGGQTFNVIPKQNTAEKVTISADDIKRVKALGFLHNKGTNCFNARVITRNGRVTAKESEKIAQAAEMFGDGHIAMTTRLTMELSGIPYDKIDDLRAFLAEEGLETGGTGSKVRPVVSCKGTTCQYGLIDTFDLSNKIHERFYKGYTSVKLPHKFKIAVGGCPNNCVKPDLNDLGIIGQRVPLMNEEKCRGCAKCQVEASCPIGAAKMVDGVLKIDMEACNHCGRCVGKCPFHANDDMQEGYRIYIGGRWGKQYAHGIPLGKIFTSEEEVMQVVEKAILLFREQGKTGERFADTIKRIGFENVEKQLLGNEILERRDEIIGAKLHLVGGATC